MTNEKDRWSKSKIDKMELALNYPVFHILETIPVVVNVPGARAHIISVWEMKATESAPGTVLSASNPLCSADGTLAVDQVFSTRMGLSFNALGHGSSYCSVSPATNDEMNL